MQTLRFELMCADSMWFVLEAVLYKGRRFWGPWFLPSWRKCLDTSFFPIVGLDSDPGSEEISSGAWGHRLGDFSNFVVHSSAFVWPPHLPDGFHIQLLSVYWSDSHLCRTHSCPSNGAFIWCPSLPWNKDHTMHTIPVALGKIRSKWFSWLDKKVTNFHDFPWTNSRHFLHLPERYFKRKL